MKRMLAIVVLCLLATGCVLAESVGVTPGGMYILRHLTDDTEEEIFFVSQLPWIECEKEDYNGDGLTDLAVVTRMEGGNTGYELFVMTENGLVMAVHDGNEAALWSFDADEQGLWTMMNDGLSQIQSFYCWQGTDLHLMRQLVCAPLETVTVQNRVTTRVTDMNQYHITVMAGEEVLFDETAAPDAVQTVVMKAEEWMK